MDNGCLTSQKARWFDAGSNQKTVWSSWLGWWGSGHMHLHIYNLYIVMQAYKLDVLAVQKCYYTAPPYPY